MGRAASARVNPGSRERRQCLRDPRPWVNSDHRASSSVAARQNNGVPSQDGKACPSSSFSVHRQVTGIEVVVTTQEDAQPPEGSTKFDIDGAGSDRHADTGGSTFDVNPRTRSTPDTGTHLFAINDGL
jgi:hypothetical protein